MLFTYRTTTQVFIRRPGEPVAEDLSRAIGRTFDATATQMDASSPEVS
jgi:hypothetical protein